MNKRKIFVLLTRFPDEGSKMIESMCKYYYTHASIGLDEDMNTFYSFVVKGFIIEKITRYIKPDREPYPCQLYELEVTEKEYERLKKILNQFVTEKSKYHYNHIGVVLCLLRIPFVRKNHFFCSHFVAEVLERSKIVQLKKSRTLYLPMDFHNIPGMRLNYHGNLRSMAIHFGLLPALNCV